MTNRSVGKHHGDLRCALLAAGRALVDADAPVTLREVARRAGVSPGAPYHHFRSHEHLRAALAQEGFEALAAALRGVTAPEPGARLAEMAATYVRFGVAHGPMYRLLFDPTLADAAEHPALDASARAAFGILVAAVATVAACPPEAAAGRAVRAWALGHGAVLLLLDGHVARLGVSPEGVAEQVGADVVRIAREA